MKHIILFLTLLISTVSATYAESNEIDKSKFIVKNISVDEVAITSDEARKNAVIFAQKRAFEIMLSRIFEDLGNVDFSFEQISSIVQAIEFREEIITNKRYKAVVDVYFQPEQTQFFINNTLLNKPIEKLSVLLIPLFNENGMVKLWQQGNIWFEAWRRITPSEMIEFKVLLGDIDDMVNFKVSELENITAEHAETLSKQYQVDKIIIADVKYMYQTISEEIKFKAYLKELGDPENATLVARSEGFKTDDYNKHMDYLAAKVVANIESGWMQYNNSLEDANKQMFVVKIKNLTDLEEIKERIKTLEIVKSFKVDSFSARYARVTVEFIEKPLEILDLMKDLGFKISREQNYVILQTR